MPQQQWFWVRNNGESRVYMHHGLARLPGKVVMMAPGFTCPVLNGRIEWPSGAIIGVDRFVFTASPALGKQNWTEVVTLEDFAATLKESLAPEVVPEPEPVVETLPEPEPEPEPKEAPEPPKRGPGRPRKAQ
jgi:hypothetical protein